ncbi:MAG: hypothetical protein ACC645_26450, partial [Pirellulales bacterium]
LRFLHTYIVRLGFLDGLAGLQVCMLTGYSSFMKQARLWELWCHLPESNAGPDEVGLEEGVPPAESPSGRAATACPPVRRRAV